MIGKMTTDLKIDAALEISRGLFMRHPELEPCRGDFNAAFDMLLGAYAAGGKVLVCGNGGSAADAEHIVGELMKSFRRKRRVPESTAAKLRPDLASRLEGALPAVSLVSMSGIFTALSKA